MNLGGNSGFNLRGSTTVIKRLGGSIYRRWAVGAVQGLGGGRVTIEQLLDAKAQ